MFTFDPIVCVCVCVCVCGIVRLVHLVARSWRYRSLVLFKLAHLQSVSLGFLFGYFLCIPCLYDLIWSTV